jgi:hypothetical protein
MSAGTAGIAEQLRNTRSKKAIRDRGRSSTAPIPRNEVLGEEVPFGNLKVQQEGHHITSTLAPSYVIMPSIRTA